MTKIVNMQGQSVQALTSAEIAGQMEEVAARYLRLEESGKPDAEAYRSVAMTLFGMLTNKKEHAPHTLTEEEADCLRVCGNHLVLLMGREDARAMRPVAARVWRFVGWCGGPILAASLAMGIAAVCISLLSLRVIQ